MVSPAWHFPDDRRFHVTDQTGTWSDCTFVSEDDETVTIDYTAAINGSRIRAQIRREDIRCVSFPLGVMDKMELEMRRG